MRTLRDISKIYHISAKLKTYNLREFSKTIDLSIVPYEAPRKVAGSFNLYQ